MSIWKTTLTWLGLGPDAEYELSPDPQAPGFADPALRGDARASEPAAVPTGPIGPMTERDPTTSVPFARSVQ